MGDEALEAACGAPAHGKTYTVEAYLELLLRLRDKAARLGNGWSAAAVERALMSAARVPVAPEAAGPPPTVSDGDGEKKKSQPRSQGRAKRDQQDAKLTQPGVKRQRRTPTSTK